MTSEQIKTGTKQVLGQAGDSLEKIDGAPKNRIKIIPNTSILAVMYRKYNKSL